MAKVNIMIVEDDAITAMDIENQLKNLGYGVSAKVSRGKEAIQKAKENTPDLILMDIVLKGEIDGIEAAEEIRNQYGIPVIFLTAFADKNRLERAKLTLPYGYVMKPFQDKDLEVTIEMALYVAKADAERKQAEEALREERGFAEGIINTAQVIILVLDVKGRIVRFNPYMEEVSGYSLDEVQGKDWFATFLPAKDHKIIRDIFQKAVGDIQTRGNVNPIVTKDGSERQIEWHDKTLKDADENVSGLLAIGIDVTERKRAEMARRESENKHRTLLENIPQKIFFKDTDSIYVSCNENYAKDLKINSEEITGKTDYDFYSKKLAEKYRGDDKRIIQSGETEEIEEEYIQNGKIFIVQTLKTPVRDEIGNVKGILGIFWDVTERKQGKE